MTIGLIAMVIMGILFGLLGGGGSLLTVPILVYLFNMPALMAVSYSLFIVGITAATAVLIYHKSGLVNYKVGLKFGIPSIVSVITVRLFVVPSFPEAVSFGGNFSIKTDDIILVFFIVFAALAAYMMLNPPKMDESKKKESRSSLSWIIQGIFLGVVTGFLGAGGGFLIIPALVLIAGMDIKKTVPTSLFIIAINSILGWLSDLAHFKPDYQLLGLMMLFSIAGTIFGAFMGSKVKGKYLKKMFGVVMTVVCMFMIYKQWVA